MYSAEEEKGQNALCGGHLQAAQCVQVHVCVHVYAANENLDREEEGTKRNSWWSCAASKCRYFGFKQVHVGGRGGARARACVMCVRPVDGGSIQGAAAASGQAAVQGITFTE